MPLTLRITLVILPMLLLLLLARPTGVSSQPSDQLQPGFNQALAQVQRAESAGATSSEVAQLLVPLNRAIELNKQALQLTSPQDAQHRTQLLNQVDQILESVQTQAGQLEITASRRTLINKIGAYTFGGAAALIATLAYAYGLSLWHRYRIKRTFQMKVVPK